MHYCQTLPNTSLDIAEIAFRRDMFIGPQVAGSVQHQQRQHKQCCTSSSSSSDLAAGGNNRRTKLGVCIVCVKWHKQQSAADYSVLYNILSNSCLHN